MKNQLARLCVKYSKKPVLLVRWAVVWECSRYVLWTLHQKSTHTNNNHNQFGNRIKFISVRQNYEHKHRTKVYVMHVTDELADWEDSRNMDRKRQWFSFDDALQQLALHKPVQRRYLQQLKNSKSLTSTTGAATIQETNSVDTTNNTATPANLLATSTPPQPPASTMQQMQPTTNQQAHVQFPSFFF